MAQTEEQKRAARAEQQRLYRERTGGEYDKRYKKTVEKAQRRLAHQFPKAYRRLLNEERAKEGLGPLQTKEPK